MFYAKEPQKNAENVKTMLWLGQQRKANSKGKGPNVAQILSTS